MRRGRAKSFTEEVNELSLSLERFIEITRGGRKSRQVLKYAYKYFVRQC